MTRSTRRIGRSLMTALVGLAVAMPPPAFAEDVVGAPSATPAPYRVTKGVRIAMRDGVKLSADVYSPQSGEGPWPTILVRTPYGKESETPDLYARMFVPHGYALVVQDKRGRFESEGDYIVSDHEVVDSYDTIDWIARQPWSNAKVGAYGCSDPGDATIYAALTGHPALKAVIPEAAGSTNGAAGGMYRYFGTRFGGALELAMTAGWMVENGTKYFLRPPPGLSWEDFAKMRSGYAIALKPPVVDYDTALRELPVIDILKKRGLTHTDYENLAGRELTDPFFAGRDFLKGDERPRVPALHVNSWYDFAPGVTLWQQRFFAERGATKEVRDNQFVVMSPSLHCRSLKMTSDYKVGDRPVGDPRIDLASLYVRWFDHWLKGADNGVTDMPKVQYYMLGENRWRQAAAWPIPGSRELRLYLGGGDAAGPAAAGSLSASLPLSGAVPHRLTYDPANPAPSVGGSLCCIRSDKLEGAYDQRGVEQRPDVLTYSTPKLERGVRVAGPIELVLNVSSSAPDTDFTAKLIDVYPDGTAYNIQEGILRVRYREGFDKPKMMVPGQIYQIRITLQDFANYFAPGHQIRLEVSSSNFPRFDRNLNTGGRNFDETKWVVAKNVVHVDRARPSYLMLRTIDE